MCGVAATVLFFHCDTPPGAKTFQWKFCAPKLSSSEGLFFASIVTFLLGLFQSTTFSRWWSTREKLGNVMNHISYLAITVSRCIPEDPEIINLTANLRKDTIRWLNLYHALIYKNANSDFNLSDLVKSSLLTEEESEILGNSPNYPGTAFDWAMNGLRKLAAKNAIVPAAAFPHLLGSMSNIFVSGQETAAFLETQLPYSYLHLLTLITKFHLVFIVFYGSGIISEGISTESWARIFFGLATIITNNIIYEGLLSIHDMLVNPLGNDEGDFPSGLYKQKTELFTKFVQHNPHPSVEL